MMVHHRVNLLFSWHVDVILYISPYLVTPCLYYDGDEPMIAHLSCKTDRDDEIAFSRAHPVERWTWKQVDGPQGRYH